MQWVTRAGGLELEKATLFCEGNGKKVISEISSYAENTPNKFYSWLFLQEQLHFPQTTSFFTHFTVFLNVLSLTACRMGLKLYLHMLTCSHVWQNEPVWNTKFSVVKKHAFTLCVVLLPEIMNGETTCPSPSFSKWGALCLHLRQFSRCSTWEGWLIFQAFIFLYFFFFLNYVCRHCTPHWGCICKMIYSVQHHPRWTCGDGSW